MAVPTQFPCWMNNPPNPDMIVADMGGYNAAVVAGYSYGASAPVITLSGGQTIAQVPLSAAQGSGVTDPDAVS